MVMAEWTVLSFFIISLVFIFRNFFHSAIAPPPPGSKVLLYWNKFFFREDFGWGLGNIASHCPVYNNCYATRNRNLRRVENFDAIIFHGINGQFDTNDIPRRRRSNQKYAFVSLESPVSRRAPPQRRFSRFFNTRVTYHLDSEVVWSYSDLRERESKRVVAPLKNVVWKRFSANNASVDETIDRIVSRKTRMAIWYVSHCHARSGRDQYVQELRKSIPVAIFGKCSGVQGCPRGGNCFRKQVEPNYFFYLSFENSLCEDYVTEKFFNALKSYVVPVAYGGADYTKFAPPKSYINALDFDSPKELAAYLKYLSKNTNEYKKYFQWKNDYEVVRSRRTRVVCEFCEILNNGRQDFLEVPSWFNNRAKQCSVQQKLNRQRNNNGTAYATRRTLYF